MTNRFKSRALGALLVASAVALAGACAEQDKADTANNNEVAAGAETAADQEAPKARHHRKDPASTAAFLKDKLGLTADQATELETALGQVENGEDKRSALEAILTPEQMAQFDEMHKGKKGWHHKGPKHMDPTAHAAKLQDKLGLTDEQTAQVEAAFGDSASHDDMKAALASILTADQMIELEALHADREGTCSEHDGQCDGECSEHKGMHGGHGAKHKDPAAHAAKLQSVLGLTDEQTAGVEAAFRDSTSHDDAKAALNEILTAEQLQQLMEMRSHHGKRGHERK